MTEQVMQIDETMEANQSDSKKSVVGGVMKAVLSKATEIVAKVHGMILKPFVFSVATGATYGSVSAIKGEIPYSLSGIVILLAIIGYFLWQAREVISLKESIIEISEAASKVKTVNLPDKMKKMEMPEKVNFKWFMKNIGTIVEVITTLSTLKDAPKSLMDAAGTLKSYAVVLNPMMIGIVFLMTLVSSVFSVMLLVAIFSKIV